MTDRALRSLARQATDDPGARARRAAWRCRAGVHRFEWGLICLECAIWTSELGALRRREDRLRALRVEIARTWSL